MKKVISFNFEDNEQLTMDYDEFIEVMTRYGLNEHELALDMCSKLGAEEYVVTDTEENDDAFEITYPFLYRDYIYFLTDKFE